MGTNYYIEFFDEYSSTVFREHIGKNSAGWTFIFQGNNHRTVREWIIRLTNLGVREKIVDEYGKSISSQELLEKIFRTLGSEYKNRNQLPECSESWFDQGFKFSAYDFS